MKDSQRFNDDDAVPGKYIKANNERFSTTAGTSHRGR